MLWLHDSREERRLVFKEVGYVWRRDTVYEEGCHVAAGGN